MTQPACLYRVAHACDATGNYELECRCVLLYELCPEGWR